MFVLLEPMLLTFTSFKTITKYFRLSLKSFYYFSDRAHDEDVIYSITWYISSSDLSPNARTHVKAETLSSMTFNYANKSPERTQYFFFLLHATISHFSSTACHTLSRRTQGQNEFQSWIMASNEIIPK